MGHSNLARKSADAIYNMPRSKFNLLHGVLPDAPNPKLPDLSRAKACEKANGEDRLLGGVDVRVRIKALKYLVHIAIRDVGGLSPSLSLRKGNTVGDIFFDEAGFGKAFTEGGDRTRAF